MGQVIRRSGCQTKNLVLDPEATGVAEFCFGNGTIITSKHLAASVLSDLTCTLFHLLLSLFRMAKDESWKIGDSISDGGMACAEGPKGRVQCI